MFSKLSDRKIVNENNLLNLIPETLLSLFVQKLQYFT